MNKKIAVLTSGGDAPGMNACLRSVVRTSIHIGWEPYVVFDGFKGLYENKIKKVERSFVSNILNSGGTIIGTSRFEDFKKEAIRKKAIENLKEKEINKLIIIGGDGSINGGHNLSVEGLEVICIPATIDNDVNIEGESIGFDTALNTIVKMLDHIRSTTSSHNRCSIVEVMGRHCDQLALYSSLACGADFVITSENKVEIDLIIKSIKEMKKMLKREILIVISENITNVDALAEKIETESGIETRASKLGYIQRGGTPSSKDRFLGTILGSYSVLQLAEGEKASVVYLIDNKVTSSSVKTVIENKKKKKQQNFYDFVEMAG